MNFLKVANIPDKIVSKVIVDYKISEESIETLKEFGVNCIKSKKCNNVYSEISGHPDIQCIYLGNRELIIEPAMFSSYKEEYIDIGFDVIRGNTILSNKYPKDIAYNGCIIGDKFVHNLKYTDEILLERIREKDLKLINVKQGYTKCNISIINENNIITSDRGIEKELSKYLNVLFIENESNIKLENMQGFIGGATGLISNNIWCINGDINRLNNCNKVIDFLQLNNIQIVCLNNSDIIDIGSIVPIKYKDE